METTQDIDLFSEVKKIEPVLRENTFECENLRRLSSPVLNAMKDANLFKIWKPLAYGGLEMDPITTFEIIEEIAVIDSAAAWNLQITAGLDVNLQSFNDEAMDEVFSSEEEVIVAGTWHPPGQAIPVDGGFQVSGQWKIASGCLNANWFFLNVLVMEGNEMKTHPNGAPYVLLIILPASEGEVVDTWDTIGLQGTGSHDIAVKDAFVPFHRTEILAPLEKARGSAFQGPLYRNSLWYPVAAIVPPALGIARAAIDDFMDLAHNKIPNYTQKLVKDKAMTQHQIAEAEATLRAARAYFYEAIRETWKDAQDPDYRVDQDNKIKIQLASTYAVQSSAKVVEIIHELAGLSGMRKGQKFQKYFRDIYTITQHAFTSKNRYEDVGCLLLDLEPDWGYFHF